VAGPARRGRWRLSHCWRPQRSSLSRR
jgi:hypothetical protein